METRYSALFSGLSLLNTVLFLEVSVLVEFGPPFATGSTELIYSQKLVAARVKLRVIKL